MSRLLHPSDLTMCRLAELIQQFENNSYNYFDGVCLYKDCVIIPHHFMTYRVLQVHSTQISVTMMCSLAEPSFLFFLPSRDMGPLLTLQLFEDIPAERTSDSSSSAWIPIPMCCLPISWQEVLGCVGYIYSNWPIVE